MLHVRFDERAKKIRVERGDLLAKLGRNEEARVEFERAAGLAGNARERELLQARARAMTATR